MTWGGAASTGACTGAATTPSRPAAVVQCFWSLSFDAVWMSLNARLCSHGLRRRLRSQGRHDDGPGIDGGRMSDMRGAVPGAMAGRHGHAGPRRMQRHLECRVSGGEQRVVWPAGCLAPVQAPSGPRPCPPRTQDAVRQHRPSLALALERSSMRELLVNRPGNRLHGARAGTYSGPSCSRRPSAAPPCPPPTKSAAWAASWHPCSRIS